MDPETNDVNENDETIENNDVNENEGGEETAGDDVQAQLADLQKQLEAAKAQSRKWEKRAKADQNEQVAELRAEIESMRAAAARSALIDTVSSELEVSRDILGRMTGDDEATIRANAELLKGITPPKNPLRRTVPDGGESKPPTMTREQIESIEDPEKRIFAIARNRNLFE